jgi:hypothetical protein
LNPPHRGFLDADHVRGVLRDCASDCAGARRKVARESFFEQPIDHVCDLGRIVDRQDGRDVDADEQILGHHGEPGASSGWLRRLR